MPSITITLTTEQWSHLLDLADIGVDAQAYWLSQADPGMPGVADERAALIQQRAAAESLFACLAQAPVESWAWVPDQHLVEEA